ncbi:hypothetical protein [Enterococcus sp. AZ192]|uniref:hypothetical protein n=1 Tax=unclassified Enterococcus TaxID=2608891 RepID=UPI003D27FF19
MRKINKRFLVFFSLPILICIPGQIGYAAEIDRALENDVEVRMTNMETLEDLSKEVKITAISDKPALETFTTKLGHEYRERTVEAEFSLPDDYGTRASQTGTSNNGIVTASVTITYSFSGNQVQVSNCSGNWSKSSSSVFITNRYVTYRGPIIQQTGYGYPTTDSFSYNTGFAYATKNTAGNGRGYSSAYTRLSGMGDVFLEVVAHVPQ